MTRAALDGPGLARLELGRRFALSVLLAPLVERGMLDVAEDDRQRHDSGADVGLSGPAILLAAATARLWLASGRPDRAFAEITAATEACAAHHLQPTSVICSASDPVRDVGSAA